MELLSVIPSMISLFLAGAGAAFCVIIKFNDLQHLSKTTDEIKNMVKDLTKEVVDNGERLAKLEGKCRANHGL